ncbi:hypothetical protein GOQ27_04285 [Clostridium sp. D2Q-11]|uniref:Uncharacterized protein n=1 Tax=Anaeromonas frigoriresistens TaxID=2683708 RepID=A0A942Z7W1_9FIRM|nr:hypothetical protein [Anaeromonas frigoriresistens]MBS4537668.1 hypothetical protein [Anaeromonas frigoriresistens]
MNDTICFDFRNQGKDMQENKDVERREVEEKRNSSRVQATFIKYFAYILIFFGFLYFLVRYVFPMLR